MDKREGTFETIKNQSIKTWSDVSRQAIHLTDVLWIVLEWLSFPNDVRINISLSQISIQKTDNNSFALEQISSVWI